MRERKYLDWTDPLNEQAKEIPYLTLFLNKYSESSKRRVYNAIMDFALYCKKNFNKSVLEVKAIEIVQYFEEIDARKRKDATKIAKSTKTHYRDYLRAYYKYIKGVKKDFEQEKFKIPIPDAKSWDFTGKETDLEDLESEGHLLTMDAIRQILFYFFYRKYSDYDRKPSRTFIIACLIILTGARIREIVQVELKNFDLKHRWFVTEVKSRKVAKRDGMYFFPQGSFPFEPIAIRKNVKKEQRTL